MEDRPESPYCDVLGVCGSDCLLVPLEPRTTVNAFSLWAAFCMCIESSRGHRVLCQKDFLLLLSPRSITFRDTNGPPHPKHFSHQPASAPGDVS